MHILLLAVQSQDTIRLTSNDLFCRFDKHLSNRFKHVSIKARNRRFNLIGFSGYGRLYFSLLRDAGEPGARTCSQSFAWQANINAPGGFLGVDNITGGGTCWGGLEHLVVWRYPRSSNLCQCLVSLITLKFSYPGVWLWVTTSSSHFTCSQ